MNGLCEQIKAQSQECIDALKALEQLFADVGMEPSATESIYAQITENVKKSLEKMKSDTTTPLNMWRAIKGRKAERTPGQC